MNKERTKYGLTRKRHAIFPVTRLEIRPEPLQGRDMEFTFNRECEEGDPLLAPRKMILRSKSLFNLLGKMYYWHVKVRKTSGGPPTFFDSDLPTMKRLYAMGLVSQVINSERWKITLLGTRVYELNYWIWRWKQAVKAMEVEERRAKMQQFDQRVNTGWVNPKPRSQPWNTVEGDVGPRALAQNYTKPVGGYDDLPIPAEKYMRKKVMDLVAHMPVKNDDADGWFEED